MKQSKQNVTFFAVHRSQGEDLENGQEIYQREFRDTAEVKSVLNWGQLVETIIERDYKIENVSSKDFNSLKFKDLKDQIKNSFVDTTGAKFD
jgi:hypothetical protein